MNTRTTTTRVSASPSDDIILRMRRRVKLPVQNNFDTGCDAILTSVSAASDSSDNRRGEEEDFKDPEGAEETAGSGGPLWARSRGAEWEGRGGAGRRDVSVRSSMSVFDTLSSSRLMRPSSTSSCQGQDDPTPDQAKELRSPGADIYSSHLFNSESYLCSKGSMRRGFGGNYRTNLDRSTSGLRSPSSAATSPYLPPSYSSSSNNNRLSLSLDYRLRPSLADYSSLSADKLVVETQSSARLTSTSTSSGSTLLERRRSGIIWSSEFLQDATLFIYTERSASMSTPASTSVTTSTSASLLASTRSSKDSVNPRVVLNGTCSLRCDRNGNTLGDISVTPRPDPLVEKHDYLSVSRRIRAFEGSSRHTSAAVKNGVANEDTSIVVTNEITNEVTDEVKDGLRNGVTNGVSLQATLDTITSPARTGVVGRREVKTMKAVDSNVNRRRHDEYEQRCDNHNSSTVVKFDNCTPIDRLSTGQTGTCIMLTANTNGAAVICATGTGKTDKIGSSTTSPSEWAEALIAAKRSRVQRGVSLNGSDSTRRTERLLFGGGRPSSYYGVGDRRENAARPSCSPFMKAILESFDTTQSLEKFPGATGANVGGDADFESNLKKTDSSDSGIDTKTDSVGSRNSDEVAGKASTVDSVKPPSSHHSAHEESGIETSDLKSQNIRTKSPNHGTKPPNNVDDGLETRSSINVTTDLEKSWLFPAGSGSCSECFSLSREECEYEKLASAFVRSRLNDDDDHCRLRQTLVPCADFRWTAWYLRDVIAEFGTSVVRDTRCDASECAGPDRGGSVLNREVLERRNSESHDLERDGTVFDQSVSDEKKHELLMECALRKLKQLRDQRSMADTKLATAKDTLQTICAVVKEKVTTKLIYEKFQLFVDELEKVMNLLLLLSSRLAITDNIIRTLPQDSTSGVKMQWDTKRAQLVEKLEDAKSLNSSIDSRRRLVTLSLKDSLSKDECESFEATVSALIRIKCGRQWIEDRIKLAEQQLSALQNYSISSATKRFDIPASCSVQEDKRNDGSTQEQRDVAIDSGEETPKDTKKLSFKEQQIRSISLIESEQNFSSESESESGKSHKPRDNGSSIKQVFGTISDFDAAENSVTADVGTFSCSKHGKDIIGPCSGIRPTEGCGTTRGIKSGSDTGLFNSTGHTSSSGRATDTKPEEIGLVCSIRQAFDGNVGITALLSNSGTARTSAPEQETVVSMDRIQNADLSSKPVLDPAVFNSEMEVQSIPTVESGKRDDGGANVDCSKLKISRDRYYIVTLDDIVNV